MIKGHKEEVSDKKGGLVGLEDGGHVILKCSKCLAYLCAIWRMIPKMPTKWKARATCPYCPSKADGSPQLSFITEWTGGYALGGIGAGKNGKFLFPKKVKDSRQDVEDGDTRTVVGDISFVNEDTMLFKIIKKGEPVYE